MLKRKDLIQYPVTKCCQPTYYINFNEKVYQVSQYKACFNYDLYKGMLLVFPDTLLI